MCTERKWSGDVDPFQLSMKFRRCRPTNGNQSPTDIRKCRPLGLILLPAVLCQPHVLRWRAAVLREGRSIALQHALLHHVKEEHILDAQLGAFGEVVWTFQGHRFQIESMIRHYLSLFVEESTK